MMQARDCDGGRTVDRRHRVQRASACTRWSAYCRDDVLGPGAVEKLHVQLITGSIRPSRRVCLRSRDAPHSACCPFVMTNPPIIDISALLTPAATNDAVTGVAAELYAAFTTWGFCQIVGHGVSRERQDALVESATAYFALPYETKLEFDVRKGGVAWRGYMPRGGEGTHGRTDRKEGIYIGPEHPDDHPLVQAGIPLHGRNRLPSDDVVSGMRDAVLGYVDDIVNLGKVITEGASLALKLQRDALKEAWLTPEPVALFRCFKYAPLDEEEASQANTLFGIGEHTGQLPR